MTTAPTVEGRLRRCPGTPNCVCSDDERAPHAIAPIRFEGDANAAWQRLLAHLEADSGYTIVEQQSDYVRAEARTRWLRFVDDVEFHLRPRDNQIAMRSASRLGYSDLGTNRRRLEAVRRALEDVR